MKLINFLLIQAISNIGIDDLYTYHCWIAGLDKHVKCMLQNGGV